MEPHKGAMRVAITAIIFTAVVASAVANDAKRYLVLALLSGAIEFFSV